MFDGLSLQTRMVCSSGSVHPVTRGLTFDRAGAHVFCRVVWCEGTDCIGRRVAVFASYVSLERKQKTGVDHVDRGRSSLSVPAVTAGAVTISASRGTHSLGNDRGMLVPTLLLQLLV